MHVARWVGGVVVGGGGSLLALGAMTHAATPPKNVILFIGDGLGAEQVRASGYCFNGAAGQFNFEQFPNFAWMTHNNAAGGLTDSAASGTALATGLKVNNNVISVALADGTDPRRATPSDGRDLAGGLEMLEVTYTPIPEPSACGFAILTAASLLRRHRRRCR